MELSSNGAISGSLVKDPECLPRQDALLYAGPDQGLPADQAGGGECARPGARDRCKDGSWLLVELASGRTGWGIRSQLRVPRLRHRRADGDRRSRRFCRQLPLRRRRLAAPAATATATADCDVYSIACLGKRHGNRELALRHCSGATLRHADSLRAPNTRCRRSFP